MVRPVFWIRNQVRPYRIVLDVIPLFAETFIPSEQVVEKFLLPNWTFGKRKNHSLAGPLFPSLHELAERFGVGTGGSQEMNVIRHDYLFSNMPPVPFSTVIPFVEQDLMRYGIVENRDALFAAAGYEIHWIFWENPCEAFEVRTSFL